MGYLSWRGKANSPVLALICCITMVFTFSCTGGGGGSGDSSDSGSVSFSLALQEPNLPRALGRQVSDSSDNRFDCETNNISTIEAQIKDENGEVVAEGGPFDCEAGEGTVDGIDPGSNYTVCIFAKNSEDSIIFEGESDPFAVFAGEVTDAGLIVLASINARLIGDFIGTGFGFDNTDFFIWTALIDADFTGSGLGSFENLETSDGSIDSGSLLYNLDFDGSLTVTTLSDGSSFQGILNNDNNILAVADTEPADDSFIEMDVAIKKSAGLSNASLTGDYIGVRISNNGGTALTALNFVGDGNGTFEFLKSSNDFRDSGGFTYTVESEGETDIIGLSSGNITSKGIVSFDGTVVSLVDTQEFGNFEDIDMAVLIKASRELSKATLDGDYIGVSFAFFTGDSSEPPAATTWNISSDGAGNVEFAIDESSSSVRPPFEPIETIYSVNDSDGSIEIGPSGNTIFDGIVNAKGDVFTFVDTNPDDELVEMGIAIRKKTQ